VDKAVSRAHEKENFISELLKNMYFWMSQFLDAWGRVHISNWLSLIFVEFLAFANFSMPEQRECSICSHRHISGSNSHAAYRPVISLDALSLCTSLAPNIVAVGTEEYSTRPTFHLRPSVNYVFPFRRLLRTLNYVQTACTEFYPNLSINFGKYE